MCCADGGLRVVLKDLEQEEPTWMMTADDAADSRQSPEGRRAVAGLGLAAAGSACDRGAYVCNRTDAHGMRDDARRCRWSRFY